MFSGAKSGSRFTTNCTREHATIAAMSFEGIIGEIDLIARLVELGREQFTGAIRFENDGIIKIVYFKSGDVLSASTNDRTDSIDEILLRAGKVTREHIKQALAKRKETETLGDALLGLGFITKKELTWARRVQVIGILRSVAAWPNGSYTIVADYLPKRDEGTVFPLPQILLELIVTDNDRSRFERALDGGYAVFAKAADFDAHFGTLGLNQDAEDIAAEIDGARSATEIAAASGKDEFNTWKLLYAFEMLGLLTRTEATRPEDELPFDDIATAGVADAANVWDEPSTDTWDVPTAQYAIEDEPVPATVEVPLISSALATETHSMPVWEAEPEPEPVIPPPPPPPPPMKEAVEKAAKPNRGIGILLGAVVVIGLAFGGWAGWQWWQGRQAPSPVGSRRTGRQVGGALKPTVRPRSAGTLPAGPPATPPAVPVTTTTTPPPPPVAMTITAPPPAPTDDLRAKYDAMARQHQTSATGAYTVQFELVCQTSSLTRALAGNDQHVWFVPTTYQGKACYRVLWGQYATRDEAAKGIAEIPTTLRGGSTPVVIATPK